MTICKKTVRPVLSDCCLSAAVSLQRIMNNSDWQFSPKSVSSSYIAVTGQVADTDYVDILNH